MSRYTHRRTTLSNMGFRRRSPVALAAVSLALMVVATLSSLAQSAQAADAKIGLGTVAPFAVLAGSTVTNTGPSVISGDLGLSPGSSVTGFPPGHVIHGTEHISDGVALKAKNDLTTAYNDAAGRPMKTDVTGKDLGGMTLTPGVYEASTAMALTGKLTLNAQGNSSAVFIFKAGSTLKTAPHSSVRFVNGGSPCNVFWQVGSSATLNTSTAFIGTIMAHTSASLGTSATLQGRVLAMTGAVTLDTNVITAPKCSTSTASDSPTSTGTAGPTPTAPGSTPSDATPSTTGEGVNPGGSPSATPEHRGPAPSPTPTIPAIPRDHPHTGVGGQQDSPAAPLFGLAGLAGLGALIAAGCGLTRTDKRRR